MRAMTQSLNFLSFSGRVGRGAYAVIGFLAFAVKHNLDRLLAQSQKLEAGGRVSADGAADRLAVPIGICVSD